MNLYAFGPIAAILDSAYRLLLGFASFIEPFAGELSAALAIVTLTLVIRSVLIPVGRSQVRAEFTRRRLAPQLSELQRRYKGKPEVLQRKMMELYATEKTSPFAGILPALAQAPVLSLLYGLFVLAVINGHTNALLGMHLFGVPLGTSLVAFLGAGMPPLGLAVFAALLLAIAATAWMARRHALKVAAENPPIPSVGGTAGRAGGGAAASAPMPTPPAWLPSALSWLPFITVVFAVFVPLAATLYLAVTTAWTLIERAWLRRALAPR
ncbi:YidC/Oxa1 family membrane protein insertase [Leifsonia flava]|uniref:Membrane protein insertase YidC n=1 Tax=Orlajensenia leifsoniae TaxID=2561933 RepID=A0A4Y9R2P1_9MICO|nr:membrane protein insertase YidC [Leifsonia flava]TFV97983.1 membrane protein insertase YidC [Leifsonia flava]